jgi:hypothetical protein
LCLREGSAESGSSSIRTIIHRATFTDSPVKPMRFVEFRGGKRRDKRIVAVANRENAVRPINAKRSDVKKILRAAAEHFDGLATL